AGMGDRGRADPQGGRPDHPDQDRAAESPAVRPGGLPDRPGRPGRGDPRRGRAAAGGPAPDGDPGAACRRVRSGAGIMSVWSWIKLTVCLWLLRKSIKAAGWLLPAALPVPAWPATMVAVTGYGAAGLRGWPPVRLRRAAAWALLPAGVWAAV